jgi:hypothetical protein
VSTKVDVVVYIADQGHSMSPKGSATSERQDDSVSLGDVEK